MNNYPIQPHGELIGWCSSCNKLSYESDFDPATEDGQEWAECPFCGDFLITKHEEDCEKMIERIAELEAKLAALECKNIELLNSASIWRNRAICAEEELAGTNKLPRGRA